MEKNRVLIVTQEMKPYLIESQIAEITRTLPQHIQENGYEIRILMPRFGNINERRHRLHEVVRLSGINIPVHDEDHPLIIKVASLPGARMQVYFLDNEDLFKRKGAFIDAKSKKFYDDNDDRMIFFCKGVLETVKKFGWPPNIIHCHGWMTSLIPYYLKTAYKDDPIFENSKVVYSVYENSFKEKLAKTFADKFAIADSKEGVEYYEAGDNTSLNVGGAKFADAIVKTTDNIAKEVEKIISENGKPILDVKDTSEEDMLTTYQDFYDTLLEE